MSRWPTGCPTGPHFHTPRSHQPRLKWIMLKMSRSGMRGTCISGMEPNHTCPVDGRFHSLFFTWWLFLERISTENEASVMTNYGNYKVLDILVYPCPCLFPFPVCPCLPPVASPEVFQCTWGAESFPGESPGTGTRAPWSPSGRSISPSKFIST